MKKKILALVLTVIALLGCGGVLASASFGSGVEVLAESCELIKSSLLGERVIFSDGDFKRALGVADFESVTVTSLPKSTEGTLILAGRRVKENQTVKRRNIGSLVFIPSSKSVTECQFSFTVNGALDGNEIKCTLKFLEKVNHTPKITDDSAVVFAQEDIAVFDRMAATDPEGDSIEYMVVSYPKYGYIEYDSSSGKYSYTAKEGYVGSDKFAYVARDEYGNFTAPVYVELEIERRMSEVVYRDMTGKEEYTAAVAMTAMGVMAGRQVGDDYYFDPDGTVSRAEFVAMAMKAFGIKPDSTIVASFFDDNRDIPTSLVGYVATAQRLGIINGSFTAGKLVFRPNDVITKYEAGMIIAELMGKEEDGAKEVFLDIESVPVWARPGVFAMYSLGIFDSLDGNIYGDAAVDRAACASYLYRMCLATEGRI